jgi:hypothetical protein
MRTDNGPARIFSTDFVNDASTMHSHASFKGEVADDGNLEVCACMLTRVDFKWLMAGQGWWIDPHRLEHDCLYAKEVLSFALASPSLVLRACAASLQMQLGYPVSH